MTTITGIVTHVERVGTSHYGNPAYLVEIRDDSAPVGRAYSLHRTMSNASIAYSITNAEYRNAPHVFELTRAGRIRSARSVSAN